MKLPHLILSVLLIQNFVARITIVQSSIASTVSTSSQPPKTKSIAQSNNSANDYFDSGIKKYQSGDFKGAIADFGRAINLNPNSAISYYSRGSAKSRVGDKQGAISDYNLAINFNSSYPEAYLDRGNEKLALGDKQGAINDFDRAISIKPKYADAYNSRGAAKLVLGDKQGAINDCGRAISLYSEYADAYHTRGSAKSALDDKQGAIVDWKKAAELYRQQGNTNAYKVAIKEVENATKSAEDAVHPQVDQTKLEAFAKELMHLAEEFHKKVQALRYHRRDGTEGLLCAGSGRGLEDRRLYIDEFIARNMYLLTPGSADYNTVINFQNSIKTTSDVEIHACDYLNKPSDQY